MIMPAIDVPEARATKVFFSYARKDGGFVLKLASGLRADGVALWLDQLDIPKGSRWDESVESALKECGCLLVVLSPASVASANVQDEVGFALEAGKRVIPLLMSRCVVPFRLQRIQYVDFSAGYELAYQELLAALGSAGASRPPVSAPPWASWKKLAPVFGGALVAGLFVALWPRSGEVDNKQRQIPLPEVVPPGRLQTLPQTLPQTQPGSSTQSRPGGEHKPEQEQVHIQQQSAPAPLAAVMPEEQLIGFVTRYLAVQDSGDLADILSLYDVRVRYFGAKEVGREFIRDDKQRFQRRWPHRESRLAGPVRIEHLAGDLAKLSFPISWLARGQDREAVGTALDEIEVRLVGGEPKIVAERQTVRSTGKRE
jgi:hypothetical protein